MSTRLFSCSWSLLAISCALACSFLLPTNRGNHLQKHTHRNAASNQRFTVKAPLACEIKYSRLIGSNNVDRCFYHVVVDHKGEYSFKPGEYCGVIPPGISSRTNRPHVPRSYSLAPILATDDADPTRCFSLGVSAPIIPLGREQEFQNICICSQFLSAAKPGTPVNVTGPFGKLLLSPDELAGKKNMLLIATGTGIVPYMGYFDTILKHEAGSQSGKILLVFGVQSPDTFIYRDALEQYVSQFKGRLQVLVAYSRYGSLSERGYVQHKLLKYKALVKDVCNFDGRQCSIFLCGRKAMEKDVLAALMDIFKVDGGSNAILGCVKKELYE